MLAGNWTIETIITFLIVHSQNKYYYSTHIIARIASFTRIHYVLFSHACYAQKTSKRVLISHSSPHPLHPYKHIYIYNLCESYRRVREYIYVYIYIKVYIIYNIMYITYNIYIYVYLQQLLYPLPLSAYNTLKAPRKS